MGPEGLGILELQSQEGAGLTHKDGDMTHFPFQLGGSQAEVGGSGGSLGSLDKVQPPLWLMPSREPRLWPAGKKGSSLGGAGPGTRLPGKQSPVSGSNGHSEAQGLAGSASCRKRGHCPLLSQVDRVSPPLLLRAQLTPCSQGGLGPRDAHSQALREQVQVWAQGMGWDSGVGGQCKGRVLDSEPASELQEVLTWG